MATQTVLVTGGAGYIGSHTCKALSQNGFLPVVVDNLSSGNFEAVKWGPFEKGDIRDRVRLDAVMSQYKPAAIMHFAALIQVGESVQNPAAYYDNNVVGSFTLLDTARTHNVQNIVLSSTAAVYGIPQTDLITESHPTNPINPYGNTKLTMENMIRDYAAAYPLQYAILRYFNAAGADPEGELGTAYKTTTHLVPLLMQVAGGELAEMKVFGDDYPTRDGSAIRDFLHISDLAAAHVLALRHIMDGKGSVTLNLGTSKGSTVKEMLDAARLATGKPVPAAIHPRRAGDPPMLVADASAARSVLGWTPHHSDLSTILGTAWAWEQKQNRLGKIGAFASDNDKQEAKAC